MYLALLHKLKAAEDAHTPIDEVALSARETAYLALNAPRSAALGGITLFREATGIQKNDVIHYAPEASGDGGEPSPSDSASQALEKKYNALLDAQHYALHARDYKTANALAAHVPAYWEAHTAPGSFSTLDQSVFEFLCEHHPDREKFKKRILQAIKDDPKRAFAEITRQKNNGSGVIPYLVKIYGDELLAILKQPAVSVQMGGWVGLWKETVDYYPLDLLKTHLQSGDIAHFERGVLKGAAMRGYMPLLEAFTQAMQRPEFAQQNAHLLNELLNITGNPRMERSEKRFDAYRLLKAIPHEKLTRFEESEDGKIADFIAFPERRDAIIRQIDAQHPSNPFPKAQFLKQVAECDDSEAIKAALDFSPDAIRSSLWNTLPYPNNFKEKIQLLHDSGHGDQVFGLIKAIYKGEELHELTKAEALAVIWPYLDAGQKINIAAIASQDVVKLLEEDPSATKLKQAIVMAYLEKDPSRDHYAKHYWEVYFDNADFVQRLPQSVLKQSPYGFKKEVYDKLLPLTQMAVRIEGTGDAAEMAYKLTVLFQSEKKAEKFLNQYADRENSQAIHDLLLFDLPGSGKWDIETWQQLVMRDSYGPKIMKILGLAAKVEEAYCEEHPGKPTKQLHGLRNLSIEQLYEYARKHSYEQSHENPELANLCISVGADKYKFIHCLEILKHAAAQRNMPELAIDGETIGLKGFRLRTVASNDPLNLWIGKLIKCCNHIGGETEPNAIEQCVSPDVALYVVEKKTPLKMLTGKLLDAIILTNITMKQRRALCSAISAAASSDKVNVQLTPEGLIKTEDKIIAKAALVKAIEHQYPGQSNAFEQLLDRVKEKMGQDYPLPADTCLKSDDLWFPVAKVTGWLGQNGDKLVFNSWERLGAIYDRLCEPFLLAAGIEAITQKPELQEVRLGRNRGGANFTRVPDVEPPRNQKLLWYDAGQVMEGVVTSGQHAIATREKLKLAGVKLAQLAKRSTQDISPASSDEQIEVPRYTPPRSRAG